MVSKGSDGRYYKPCPICGVEQSYLRKWYAEQSEKLGKMCKRCSNSLTDNSNRGWHKGIRVTWFKRFQTNAELRNIPFDIDIDYVADVFESQDFRCALSGEPLYFPEVGLQDINASIDRIKSELGYVKGNIQIVHKHLNMMKQQYDNDYFIEMCKKVAKFNE